MTDEDMLPDGTVKPMTMKARQKIQKHQSATDLMLMWPGDLERCLGVVAGKATPEVVLNKLSDPAWQIAHPDFTKILADLAAWIDPKIAI